MSIYMNGNEGGAYNSATSIGMRVLTDSDALAEDYPDLEGKVQVYSFTTKAGVISGAGQGRALLAEVTAWADQNGHDLVLIAAASGPIDQPALKAWYERNGFKDCVDYMLRKHHTKEHSS